MSDIKRITDAELNALAKPIPRQLVKSASRQGKSFSYVTARTVMNRLDEELGRANWRTEYRIVWQDPLTVECTLYVRIDGEWVGKADVGTEENYSPQKAAYSNALKRAGAQWGIARELYGEGNVYEEDDDTAHIPASQQPRSVINQMADVKPKPAKSGQKADTPAPGDAVLDAHFGPRNPAKASMADEMPENADDAARARDRAQKTFPFAKDDKLTPWQEFMASHRTWTKKFWPAAKALGFATNDAVHAALGVDSMKDVQGATGMMWLALVKAAPPEQMELDPTGTDG